VPTVAELLQEGLLTLRAAGSESARLDAELLLGHVAGLERTALLAHPDVAVPDGAAARYREAVARREAGEPVAYIRGLKEFYGLAFAVDPRALIPRPETERLVELAEAEVVRRLVGAPRPAGAAPIEVVDVGTGSGAAIIALAVSLRRRGMLDEVRLLATDVSSDAVGLARENAVAHALADRIDIAVADLLPSATGPWDVLLANLPYVRTEAMASLPRATAFEPRRALDGGPDGLTVIARLLDSLPGAIGGDGAAFLEIGADQGDAIRREVERRLPGWSCRVELDLAHLPRVARIERLLDGGSGSTGRPPAPAGGR
jgi:release factor glutamine methyltransferase